MGALLLCNYPIAKEPYHLEALSLNLYSLEELCYVIEHHPYLLEERFFSNELLDWIIDSIGAEELAEKLRQALEEAQGIVKAAELLLNAVGYLNYEESGRVLDNVRQMQHMTMFERRKMRADRYAENERYVQALLEYQRVVQMESECKKDPVVCGNIWHNQGVVYARLFFFKEARECFEKAYRYHMNVESLYAAIAACKFLGDENKAEQLQKKYGIDASEITNRSENWFQIGNSEKFIGIEEEIEAAGDEVEKLQEILNRWKMEYQKHCK